MKHLLTIIILGSSAAVLTAAAATSPLASASDYYFTAPALTNNIRGKVMGDSGDYGIFRSEDLAFIAEAIAEREALFNGTGSQASWTNHISSITNGANRLDSLEINPISITIDCPVMNPDNDLSEAIRILEPATNTIAYTNNQSYLSAKWMFETNHVRYAQIMTNGVEDVYTNQFEFMSFTNYHVVVWSNALGEADLCTTDYLYPFPSPRNLVPNLQNSPSGNQKSHYYYGGEGTHPGDPTYSKGQLTNLYALVRGIKRTRPRVITQLYPTNFVSVTFEKRYGDTDPANWTDGETISTNSYQVDFKIENDRSHYEKKYIDTSEDNPHEHGDPTDYFHSRLIEPQVTRIVFSSGVLKSVNTTGGVERVKKAHVFACCSATYSQYNQTTWSTTNSATFFPTFATNLTKTVMIPLGTATPMNVESYDFVCLGMEFDNAAILAKDALELCGYPSLTYRQYSSNYLDGQAPERIQLGTDYYMTEFFQYCSDTLMLSPLKYYAVLEFEPRTTLESWKESQ